MDMDTVRELVSIAKKNQLSELTVRDKDLRVTVRLQDATRDAEQKPKAKSKRASHVAPTVSEAIDPLPEVKPESEPLPLEAQPIPVPAIGVGDFQDTLPEVFKSAEPRKTPAFSGKHAATARIPLAWVPVTSPMVGTYREAPEAGEPSYVKVGDSVKPGQTLCSIEALGELTEIAAEEAGTIREACLQDGTAVEFGTTLFYLQPSDSAR